MLILSPFVWGSPRFQVLRRRLKRNARATIWAFGRSIEIHTLYFGTLGIIVVW